MQQDQRRRMHVEDGDWVPPSLLRIAVLTKAEILGGVGGSGAFYGGLGLGWLAFTLAMGIPFCGGAGLSDEERAANLIEEEEVIAARFLRSGIDFEDQLPNREVPQLRTKTPEGQAISKRPRERDPNRPDAGPVDNREAQLDILARLSEDAQIFAEITEPREREGDPDGIQEGTETEATDGNRYAGQIYAFFRRGWTVPTTISDEEKENLSIEATLEVGEDLHLQDYQLRGTSGNPDFDQSVRAQLDRIQQLGLDVPEPPISVRPRYVGTPFTLRFRGRQAGR